MALEFEIYFQAVISLLVITAPFDPIKILFFGQAISTSGRSRNAGALSAATYVAIILAGSALIGKPLLSLMGINLDAFRVVGGIIIALMGFEMLYGGGTSKVQGEDQRKHGPEEGDALLIPLALPLIAGPGAITTTITLAAGDDGLIAALIGIAVVAVVTFMSFAWLGKIIETAKPSTVAVLARIGGLLLATIGMQMALGGLKSFFA